VSFSALPAGEYIYGGRAVAVNSSGYAILADPFSEDRSRVVGISAADTAAGQRVRVIRADYCSVNTAGMTRGRPAYLSIEGSGRITTDLGSVVSGYTEFYNPFYVTDVGRARDAGVLKIEIEDNVLTGSPNSAILTEDQVPLIEYIQTEDSSKILLESA